ncbi:hypothetical protein MTR67_052191 [Solanum verrucosum]|uniref:Uncharacterized protein n=1 Tax=Solanum verrucosum TaxID=315347 RepID=A0AAF0V8N6_SOLVR|nr:hypothetical protein MTR67_052191 [Solanum verrucosum]
MLLEEELSAELYDEDATNLIRLKAVLEKIVPASDNKKKCHTKAQKGLLRYADDLAVKPRNLPQMGKAYICRGDANGDAEYSLLVNLKRLDDDLQLSRQISIESLHNNLAETPPKAYSSGKRWRWKKVEDLCLRSQVQSPHHAKRNPATLYLKLRNSPGTIFIFLISRRSALFDLLESFLTTKYPEGCVIFSEQWWLFRKATLASSTELKALVYSSDICNGISFQSWESDHGSPYFHAYGIEKILWI